MREYVSLEVNRLNSDRQPTYELAGLPEGANFHNDDAYDRFYASMLKVNDYAFFTQYAEFGEYQQIICVEQETDGGLANIVLDE